MCMYLYIVRHTGFRDPTAVASQLLTDARHCLTGSKPHIGPLLVVCLTNHALDSFLEDLLDSGATTSLVRVGGRSKSPRLEQYNLRNSGVKVSNGFCNVGLYCVRFLKDHHVGRVQRLLEPRYWR